MDTVERHTQKKSFSEKAPIDSLLANIHRFAKVWTFSAMSFIQECATTFSTHMHQMRDTETGKTVLQLSTHTMSKVSNTQPKIQHVLNLIF